VLKILFRHEQQVNMKQIALKKIEGFFVGNMKKKLYLLMIFIQMKF